MDAYVASKLRGHCAQGQTLPLYLGCRVDGEEIVYQSKVAGRRSGLSPRELGVEMLSTTIAHDAGLHVARPALITLTQAMIDSIEAEYAFGVQDAIAFGSIWKPWLTPFLPDFEVDRLSEDECATLLAIDLILTNGDRTEPNPNICWEGSRLLVFDFEHCLELPRLDYGRRYALHLESLQPLFDTHVVANRVEIGLLRWAVQNVLDNLAVEALRRDAFALSGSWFGAWTDNVEYLGYIKDEQEPLMERIGELRA